MSLAPPSSSTAMSSYNNTSLSTALCSYRCSPRITKENLFMLLALWMEDFPVESEQDLANDTGEDTKLPHSGYRKVGAVLVLPGTDILYAVDCTRDGVHAVARLLMNHPDIAKGCKVFVSRKPCSFCTKLLVQCKVGKVYFSPFEPEFHGVASKQFDRENSQVDTLFRNSSVEPSLLVPKVATDAAVLEREEPKHKPKEKSEAEGKMVDRICKKTKELFDKFCKEKWIKTVKDNFSLSVFDENMFKQDFTSAMKWMAQILVESRLEGGAEISFQPVVEGEKLNELQSKQFAHLIGMAQFLARRTDHDPKKGVGAVIANEKMEIKGLGWNGFPLKAIDGEFPRASANSPIEVEDFIIHAEQNAFLMRNDKNLKDVTLFVTMTPCDECVPLIQMEEIKTVVLGKQLETKAPAIFREKVNKGQKDRVITCYELHVHEGRYRRYWILIILCMIIY